MEILRFPGLGWELPISRVALSIGNLDIYWYGVIIAVGFGLGLWVYLSHNRTCGIHRMRGWSHSVGHGRRHCGRAGLLCGIPVG